MKDVERYKINTTKNFVLIVEFKINKTAYYKYTSYVFSFSAQNYFENIAKWIIAKQTNNENIEDFKFSYVDPALLDFEDRFYTRFLNDSPKIKLVIDTFMKFKKEPKERKNR